jgi:pyruvate/2-oxoglutarate dehydrogenase complex dihydrolipoamide dehydrogenase (E3) component
VVTGQGTLLAPGRIRVDPSLGRSQAYGATHIILATGSRER